MLFEEILQVERKNKLIQIVGISNTKIKIKHYGKDRRKHTMRNHRNRKNWQLTPLEHSDSLSLSRKVVYTVFTNIFYFYSLYSYLMFPTLHFFNLLQSLFLLLLLYKKLSESEYLRNGGALPVCHFLEIGYKQKRFGYIT